MSKHPDLMLMTGSVKMPMMQLPTCATAVRLSTGVVLISPVARMLEYMEDLEAFGPMSDLVAPSLLHHLSLPLAIEAFPQARVWGAPGLQEKRPDIPWTSVLNPETWPHQRELPLLGLQGLPGFNECVFFHPASRSLIVTDLCFNLRKTRGLGPWLILSLFGTYQKFGVSRLYLGGVKNKEAFKNSLREMMKFDFENLIMAHGEPLWGNAKPRLLNALAERGISL